MFLRWEITAVGYAAAAMLGWLYVNELQDHARDIERCNTEKAIAIAEAERVASKASQLAARAHIAELDKMAEEVAAVRKELDQSKLSTMESQLRTEKMILEAAADAPDSCLNAPVDPAIVDSLRNGEGD